MLLTKEEIEATLKKSLPHVSDGDIRKAALSLLEATGKWQEVDLSENLGANISVQCQDICALGAAHHQGCRIRAFILPK